ncbi:hypothetical protein NHQ30_000484 [Ciborinia camelliae]|nr:hypothetical protein NHQ30_000484 [Ciborinia camelliae]
MLKQESNQHLLEEEHLDFEHQAQPRFKRSWFHRARYLIAACAMSCSVLLNIYLTMNKSHHELEDNVSKYAKLPSDVTHTYQFYTDYWGENETLVDELWENINVDPVAVATLGTPTKASTSSKFTIACTVLYEISRHRAEPSLTQSQKVMRKAFKDLLATQENKIEMHHVWHCLDSLRQDLMCRVDDTPMPIPPGQGNVVGNTQMMMCRDLNKLREWSQEGERNACYREVNDYRPVAHSLERHAFCPEDSEDYPVMKAYFDLHGHKPMFAD